jgi:hypothetical protein
VVYIDTTNQNLWFCSATNSWKQPTASTSGLATRGRDSAISRVGSGGRRNRRWRICPRPRGTRARCSWLPTRRAPGVARPAAGQSGNCAGPTGRAMSASGAAAAAVAAAGQRLTFRPFWRVPTRRGRSQGGHINLQPQRCWWRFTTMRRHATRSRPGGASTRPRTM